MIAAQHLALAPTGRDRWVVPWAMSIDSQRRCYLNPRCDAHEQPVGSCIRMRVRHERDGFHVFVERVDICDPATEYRWHTEASDNSVWFAIPVAALWIDGARQDGARLPEDLVVPTVDVDGRRAS